MKNLIRHKTQNGNFFIFSALILLMTISLSCSRKPASTADIPRLLSPSIKVSVAPFTHPLNPGQLISGQLPRIQGFIPEQDLQNLDMSLREVLLNNTKRNYNFLPANALPPDWNDGKVTPQPTGLEKWLAYGKKYNVQYLLVPQVLDWHERQGSEAGVTEAAYVRLDFYLINVPAGNVVAKSSFEEQQVGLADNLLDIVQFFKRKGRWITAGQLSADGMLKAVKDFGL